MKKTISANTILPLFAAFLLVPASPAAGKIIFVDVDATGANNGSSWQDAHICLQDALTTAEYGDEIRVAQGVYKPDGQVVDTRFGQRVTGSGSREATFQLKNGVLIKGGYAGFGEPDPNSRDIKLYKTTLSGDLKGNDVDIDDPSDLLTEPSRRDNSYHIVTGGGTNETAVLDGFTIIAGNANGDYLYNRGAGMYNYHRNRTSNPIVANCTFSNNSAGSGGAMFNSGIGGSENAYGPGPTLTNCTFRWNHAGSGGAICTSQSRVTLTNCTFIANSANSTTGDGGAIAHWSGHLTLTNCTFSENSAYMGGGLNNGASSALLTNCTFTRNSASLWGGGMWTFGRLSPTLVSCTFDENWAAEGGGGMHNYGLGSGWWCTPTLIDCTFIGNSSGVNGGAMLNEWSKPTLTDCTFTKNIAPEDGGGMYNCYNSIPTMTRCAFSENSASKGAAIHNQHAHPTLTRCTFSRNSADTGGAIYNDDCRLALSNCTFTGNSAQHSGGGVYNYDSTPTVINCTFNKNSAHLGGGICNIDSDSNLSNCVFFGNSATSGGGMWNYGSDPELTTCTIRDNMAEEDGGGICCARGESNMRLTNSILWGNTALRGPQIAVTTSGSDTAYLSVSYSDVEAGQASALVEADCTLDWGPGNIDTDPFFVNSPAGDYHLHPTSACIDAGDPNYAPLSGETDIDGQPRLINSRIDMGADEFNPENPIMELSPCEFDIARASGAPNPDPLILSIRNWAVEALNWQVIEDCDWLEAIPPAGSSTGEIDDVALQLYISNLPDANYCCRLVVSDPNAANSPRVVPVNLTIHKPYIDFSALQFTFAVRESDPDPDDQVLTLRTTGGRSLNWSISYDCDWLNVDSSEGSLIDANQITLSVDVSGLSLGVYTTNLTILSPAVPDCPQTISVLLQVLGEQIHVPDQFPTIQAAIDHTIETGTVIVAPGIYTGQGNRDVNFSGKAITVRSVDPNDLNIVAATIIDCNGSAHEPHRGFCFVSGEGRDSILAGLTITNGYPTQGDDGRCHGGAILCHKSSPTIARCIIADNRTCHYSKGGGIYCFESSPAITNCIIRNNHASRYGGGICCEGGMPIISNCTIADNYAQGVYSSSGEIRNCTIARNSFVGVRCEATRIINCIVWDNGPKGPSPPAPPPGRRTMVTHSQIEASGLTVISYSDIQGGWPGIGNVDTDPCFVDPNTGDYHLSGYSLCINAGDPNYSPAPGETDIDGQPRVMNSWVDIGSDETPAITPIIHVSQERVEFLADQGGTNPADQTLMIRNKGLATLTWKLAEDCPWLQVSSKSGESTGQANQVVLSIDVAGLTAGLYDCNLTISDPCATNSPRTVAVALHVFADVVPVPSQLPTIQGGIDHAKEGGIVVVADGVYTGPGNRDIDFRGKSTTVRSENGPENCIIDCNATDWDEHRAFHFHSGEDANSVVDGFTITNGYAFEGGGILCTNGSNPTIINCKVANNRVPYPGPPPCGGSGSPGGYGAGICCKESHPIIANCTIENNEGGGAGGGIFGPAIVSHCSIHANKSSQGGGIADAALITNCTVTANEARNGAGLYCGTTQPEQNNSYLIAYCILADNSAQNGGGAIHCADGTTLIENCVIKTNLAGEGGGICCSGGTTTIRDCIIRSNRSSYGGGFCCQTDADLTVYNCTIGNNSSSNHGGGLSIWYDNNPRLKNCILWGNMSGDEPGQPAQIFGGAPGVDYCCIEGWTGTLGGVGNTGQDPLLTRDHHLQSGSPCIDAGDPGQMPGPNDLDIDGETRFYGNRVDIGADEFVDIDRDGLPDWWELQCFGSETAAGPDENPDGDPWNNAEEYARSSNPMYPRTRYFVDPEHGSDGWDGLASTWNGQNGPKATIQAAIDEAGLNDDDEIVLAPGIYTGPGNRDIDLQGKAVAIRSTDPDDPNIVAETIIDCQGSEDDNHRCFDFRRGEGPDTVIEGLTLTGGYCAKGGAVVCNNSSPTFRKCVVCDSASEYDGGGFYCVYSSSRIVDSVIRANRTLAFNGRGGGLYCLLSDCVVIDTVVEDNESSRSGGGIAISGGSGTFRNCILARNQAGAYGGGIYFAGSKATVVDCIFQRNSATYGGGGIGHDNPKRYNSPTIADCLFIGNSAEAGGGLYEGFYVDKCCFIGNAATYGGGAHSVYDISNCTFTANVALDGGGMYIYYGGPVTNCMITGNRAARDGGGLFFEKSVAGVYNCTLSSNVATGNGGGIGGLRCRSTVKDSILWANSATAGNEVYMPYSACPFSRVATISYCNIANGEEDVVAEGYNVLRWGDGNIHTDPCFVKAGYWTDAGTPYDANDDVWVDGDYHLRWNSPCVNAGDPSFVVDPNAKDCDGHARIIAGQIDMGAYEMPYLFVDDNAIFDPGPGTSDLSDPDENGSRENPYDSIQEAIQIAEKGYKVLVLPGSYREQIDFIGKAIKVCGIDGAPTLEAHDEFAVSFYGGEQSDSILQNFIINNSYIGIFIAGSYPTIRNVTIVDNRYGIEAYAAADPDITNSILWGNKNADLFQCWAQYSCIERGAEGLGNISKQPLFVDPSNGDYHLKSEGWRFDSKTHHWVQDDATSPCIDAGNPGTPLGEELLFVPADPNNEWGVNLRISMGAYGGTVEASMPPYDGALLADLTNDGTVDWQDFAHTASNWLARVEGQGGDLDRDGVVGWADLALLADDWVKQTTWHD